MHIKSRLFLVALLVASQTACLVLGMMWTTGWLWKNFQEVVYSYGTAEGKVIAQEVAFRASKMKLGDIQPGSKSWEALQQLCEEEKIPYRGFVSVMRRDNGAMLCHPDLAKDPGLLRLFPGRGLIISDFGTAPLTQIVQKAETLDKQVVTGKVELDGNVHVVTAYSLPRSNAILAVYQSDEAIDNFIVSIIRPVMQVGYILTAFVVGASALITVFLINRYETGLAVANEKLEQQVYERTRSLVRTRNAVIFGLAKLAESRDRDTGGHLERIRSYVSILATELAKTNPEIDRSFVADLAIASSLHDIGKVGIPDAVLLKPGKLTPTERTAIQMHTVVGSECLSAIQENLGEDDFLQLAQQIILAHHEHWDGSGYPHGTQGKNIPLSARIVALADVYDALTSSRPYKGPIGHNEVRERIVSRFAQQFDPQVVEAFLAREADFRRVYQNIDSNSQDESKEPNPANPTSVAEDATC